LIAVDVTTATTSSTATTTATAITTDAENLYLNRTTPNRGQIR